jgi:hypothetical protein
MAKTPQKKRKPEYIKTIPDVWERFERTIDKVTHTALKPRTEKSPKKKKT